ncbi:MAG: DUF4255 domain-containing protein [Gammaproteobacteria bacterium]|nr:DUF4255 domain-containing protein [Gammaproteobacteria bacterium]
MSNSLAIAATTATLRNLLLAQVPTLDSDLSDLEVTAQPLDVARKGISKSQVNLFLYQTAVNAAWRNMDMPRQVRPGETGLPPLAINLHYLITAYGRGDNDNDAVSHRVLGGAMSVLHDHALLSRSEISIALANNDLSQQFERVRITPLSLGVEEISRLWMVFQTQYRISMAYEVTVILIDSRTPGSAPLPVLKRGETDRGVITSPGAAPMLTALRLPRSQPAIRLGEDAIITGDQLTIADATLRFSSLRLPQVVELPPTAGGNTGEISFHVPDTVDDVNALSRWLPGFYTLALAVKKTGVPPIISNEIPFALAPRITVTSANTGAGAVDVTITSEPRLAVGQRVLLLFGDRQAEPTSITTPADTSQPTTILFKLSGLSSGTYVTRLRVDGVDSIPVVYSGTPPLADFDPAQKVTVP